MYQLFLSDFSENFNFFNKFSKKKSLIIKFYQNLSCGSLVVPCGRTDRHEDNSRFSQFCDIV